MDFHVDLLQSFHVDLLQAFHVDLLQAFHVDLLQACKAKNAAKSTLPLLLTCKRHGPTMCSIVLYWTVTNLILDRSKSYIGP